MGPPVNSPGAPERGRRPDDTHVGEVHVEPVGDRVKLTSEWQPRAGGKTYTVSINIHSSKVTGDRGEIDQQKIIGAINRVAQETFGDGSRRIMEGLSETTTRYNLREEKYYPVSGEYIVEDAAIKAGRIFSSVFRGGDRTPRGGYHGGGGPDGGTRPRRRSSSVGSDDYSDLGDSGRGERKYGSPSNQPHSTPGSRRGSDASVSGDRRFGNGIEEEDSNDRVERLMQKLSSVKEFNEQLLEDCRVLNGFIVNKVQVNRSLMSEIDRFKNINRKVLQLNEENLSRYKELSNFIDQLKLGVEEFGFEVRDEEEVSTYLKILQDSLEELSRVKGELVDGKKQLQEHLEGKKEELESAKKELREKETALAEAQEKLSNLLEGKPEGSEKQPLENLIEQLKVDREARKEKIKGLQSQTKNLEEEFERALKLISEYGNMIDEKDNTIKKLSESIFDLLSEKESLEKSREEQLDEISKLKSEIKTSEEKKNDLDKQLKEAKEALGELVEGKHAGDEKESLEKLIEQLIAERKAEKEKLAELAEKLEAQAIQHQEALDKQEEKSSEKLEGYAEKWRKEKVVLNFQNKEIKRNSKKRKEELQKAKSELEALKKREGENSEAVREAEAKLKAQQEAVTKLEQGKAENDAKLKEVEAKLASLRDQLGIKDRKIEVLTAQVNNLSKSNEELEVALTERNALREEVEDAKKAFDEGGESKRVDLADAIKGLQDKFKAQEKRVEELQQEQEAKDSEITRLAEEYEASKAELKGEVAVVVAEREKLKANLAKVEAEHEESAQKLREELKAQAGVVSNLENQKAAATEKVAELEAAVAEAERSLQEQDEKSKGELETLQAELETARNKLKSTETEAEKAKADLVDTEEVLKRVNLEHGKSIREIQGKLKANEKEIENLKGVQRKKDTQILELEREVSEVKASLEGQHAENAAKEQKLEAALKARNTAQAAVAKLQQKQKLAKAIHNWRVLATKAVAQKKVEEANQAVKTIEVKIKETSSELESAKAKLQQLLAPSDAKADERDDQGLSSLINDLDKKLQKLLDEKEKMKADARRVEKGITDISDKLDATAKDNITLIQQTVKKMDALEKERDRFYVQNQELRNTIAKYEGQLGNLRERIKVVQEAPKMWKEQNEQLRKLLVLKNEKLESLDNRIKKMKVEVNKHAEENRGLKEKEGQLLQEKTGLKEEIEQLKEAIQGQREYIKKVAGDEQENLAELIQKEERIIELQKSLQKALHESAKVEVDNEILKAEVEALQNEIKKLQEAVGQAEGRFQELDSKRKGQSKKGLRVLEIARGVQKAEKKAVEKLEQGTPGFVRSRVEKIDNQEEKS